MGIPIDPIFAVSGFFVGLLVGQTGVGGGALMTPLLVLLFGVHPATAVGTDLLYAALTKSVGAAVHGAHGSVDWRVVSRLAAGSLPATSATMLLLYLFDLEVSSHIISVVLGAALLLTALSLLARNTVLAWAARRMSRLSRRMTLRLTVLTGATLGVLVTISSVGAGALGVTALILLYPDRRLANIVGTDIAHAVPLTLVAGLGHLAMGAVDWPLLVSLLCGSIPGIIGGSVLSQRLPDWFVRPLLACVLVVVGVRLLV